MSLVAIHYPSYACTLCDGRGFRLTPVSREDYPCNHVRYKRVPLAPEIVERERDEQAREYAAMNERLRVLMSELLGVQS